MSSTPVPFPEWDGDPARHLTVAPDGTVYALPSGSHERLHGVVIGDQNPAARIDVDDLHGTKIDLALAGWVQLQSDQHTDRLNIDAPDGYDGDALIRRFARLHDAGSLRLVFYPSTDKLTSADPQQISVSHDGDRIPVTLPPADE
jgi:hypothetical protein